MRLVFILLLLSLPSFGQLCIKGGVNYSKTTSTSPRMGFQIGVGYGFKSKKFLLVPEVMLSLKRALDDKRELHLNYIEPGILAGIKYNNAYLFFGNAISFNIYAQYKKRKGKDTISTPIPLTNKIDIIQIVGAGYSIKEGTNTLFLEARLSFGYIYQVQKQKHLQIGIVAGIFF